ncbi:MAB_1171c family putative transporter [Streptomyces sp. NPDC050485]|uniref:MAB_1171c family putative transporter n=1 Tax=Streptomyces sp. NPDC050485 TaxID=3365617 RepID=UPI0037A1E4E5
MQGSSYYIPAAAMGVALAFKTPSLVRAWTDPLMRAVCSLLALAGLVFFFAAPPTIGEVNRLTGVANFSAPLVYSLLSAFSASCLVLIVNWRGGPAEEIRRTSRRWCVGFSVLIVALVTLFVLGDAPVERLRDLDTYYATTPYIREMIVLYLMGITMSGVMMNYLCLRWALQVHGWLRVGLLIIVVGYSFNTLYAIAKFAAVFARWGGANWDGLSTNTAPILASCGAQVSAVGFCLPLVCQRLADSWHTWATYRQLGPLWRELNKVSPRDARSVRIPWWSSAELSLTRRESDIHDGLLALHPYFDPEVHSRAHAAALAAGADPEQAQAVADAAMVTTAVRARAADPEGVVVDSARDAEPAATEGTRDLVRISLVLRQPPHTAAAPGHAARPESEVHERMR